MTVRKYHVRHLALKIALVLVLLLPNLLNAEAKYLTYEGEKSLTIRADAAHIHLKFNEALILPAPGIIEIIKKHGDSRQAFRDFRVILKSRSLFIIPNEPFNAGDELSIRIKKHLCGYSSHHMRKDVQVNVAVLPSLPVFSAFTHPGGLEYFVSNFQKIELTQVQFKDAFLDVLKERKTKGRGIESSDLDRAGMIRRRSTEIIIPKTHGKHFLSEFDKFKDRDGLFGFRIDRVETGHPGFDAAFKSRLRQMLGKTGIYRRKVLGLVLRAGEKNTMMWVYNKHTHKPVPGAEITVTRGKESIKAGRTNEGGLFLSTFRLRAKDTIRVMDPLSGLQVFADMKYYDNGSLEGSNRKQEYLCYIFTDRPMYKPGDTVHIGGVVKMMDICSLKNPAIKRFTIQIKYHYRDVVAEVPITTDEDGGFTFTYEIGRNSPKGDYEIDIHPGDDDGPDVDFQMERCCLRGFEVNYYQPDPIAVETSGWKKKYDNQRTFAPLVRGKYLSGGPMAGETVEYRLKVTHCYGSFDYEPEISRYRFGHRYLHSQSSPSLEIEKKQVLDSSGTCGLKLDREWMKKSNALLDIQLRVKATSKEGKEVTCRKEAIYFPGERVIGIAYIDDAVSGKQVPLKLAVIDTRCRLSSARARITVYRCLNKNGGGVLGEKAAVFENLSFSGKETFHFASPKKTGTYAVKIDTFDQNGTIVSTSRSFKVFKGDGKIDFQVYCAAEYPDNDDYRVGDTAPLVIVSPYNGKAVITLERDKILEARVVNLKKNRKTVANFQVKKEQFPMVNVVVTACFDNGATETKSTDWGVLCFDKSLKVNLTPAARKLKVGEASTIRVKVTDEQGRGRKARVFVYGVNEGSLQLHYNTSPPDLLTAFYFDSYWSDFVDIGSWSSSEQEKNSAVPPLNFSIPTRRLVGRVVDEEGEPIPGVTVSVGDWYGLHVGDWYGLPVKKIQTGKMGYYALGGAGIPGDYIVGVFAKSGYHTLRWSLEPHDGIHCQNITLKKEAPPKKTSKAQPKQIKSSPAPNIRENTPFFEITGNVCLDDGDGLSDAIVTIQAEDNERIKRMTVADRDGNFRLMMVAPGRYRIEAMVDFYQTARRIVQVSDGNVNTKLYLERPLSGKEIIVTGCAPGIPVLRPEQPLNQPLGSVGIAAMPRENFKETLFFKIVETDEQGNGEVHFKASDSLSTYRVRAVAYGEDTFGMGQDHFLVTRDLYAQEAMPEFARKGDRFEAGVLVVNGTESPLDVTVGALPEKLELPDKDRENLQLRPQDNQLVYFPFQASEQGEGKVKFYAHSARAVDAVLKKLPIHENRVTESLLTFASGKSISARVSSPAHAGEPRLTLTVSPSVLTPARGVARRLVFYSYECLEQRTSKAMPYLLLDDTVVERLNLKIDRELLRKRLTGYLDIIPQFMDGDGALSYYRGDKKPSRYLTAYVFWALHLARERKLPVAPNLVEHIESYLKSSLTAMEKSTRCLYQYVLSRDGRASREILLELLNEREKLSLTGRAFLYRAIHNQWKKNGENPAALLARFEFDDSWEVDGDTATYLDTPGEYNREYPFYSSRFASALVLQALLEVKGYFPLAPKIMKGLLQARPYEWNTTQTNFWILYAMTRYAQRVEKDGKGVFTVTAGNKSWKKVCRGPRDTFQTELPGLIPGEKIDIKVEADAPVFLTADVSYHLEKTREENRGIRVKRNVYGRDGKPVTSLTRGEVYQVELLIDLEKGLHYGVIDEPLAAGFELQRDDLATSVKHSQFNRDNESGYKDSWGTMQREYAADRLVYYAYFFEGKLRVNYFIKALYSGTFTWMPTEVRGMYHPQYLGREEIRRIEVK